MKTWLLAALMFLALQCRAQSLSVTGAVGDGAQAGLFLDVPLGNFELMSDFAANTAHGITNTESGAVWFGNHLAAWGGLDVETPHDAFAGGVVAGKKWSDFLAYYPASHGFTVYYEREVHPRWWLGFYGGYLHGSTLSGTLRFELWHKK